MSSYGGGVTLLGVFFMQIAFVMAIFGVLGMFLWPYTVNTWGEFINSDEGETWEPIGKKMGFLMGICPVVGQLGIPVAIITGFIDLFFLDDPEPVAG